MMDVGIFRFWQHVCGSKSFRALDSVLEAIANANVDLPSVLRDLFAANWLLQSVIWLDDFHMCNRNELRLEKQNCFAKLKKNLIKKDGCHF